MRDVLDGLEEAANYMSYQSTPGTLEILSVETPGRVNVPPQDVININKINKVVKRSTDNIVDYLIQRELRLLA